MSFLGIALLIIGKYTLGATKMQRNSKKVKVAYIKPADEVVCEASICREENHAWA